MSSVFLPRVYDSTEIKGFSFQVCEACRLLPWAWTQPQAVLQLITPRQGVVVVVTTSLLVPGNISLSLSLSLTHHTTSRTSTSFFLPFFLIHLTRLGNSSYISISVLCSLPPSIVRALLQLSLSRHLSLKKISMYFQ